MKVAHEDDDNFDEGFGTSSGELPRILHDPGSNNYALEYLPFRGSMPRCIDRQAVWGAFQAAVEGDNNVDASSVGFLNIRGDSEPTAHSYSELRDLLYPVERTNAYFS